MRPRRLRLRFCCAVAITLFMTLGGSASAAIPRSGTFKGKTNEHVYVPTLIEGRQIEQPGPAFQPFELRVSARRVVHLKFRFNQGPHQTDCGGYNQQFDKRVSLRVSPSGRFLYYVDWRRTHDNNGARIAGRFISPSKVEGTFQMTINEIGTNPCTLSLRKWSARLR